MKSNVSYKHVFDSLLSEFKGINSPDVADKVAHIERVARMAIRVAPFDELLISCAEFHDLPGRMAQYRVLSQVPGVGVFDDAFLDHHVLSESIFRKLIREGKLENSRALDIIRAVSLNHGLEVLWPTSFQNDSELRYYVKTVSILDDIDNGCIGAISYLAREIDSDSKSQMLESNGGATMCKRYSGIVSPKVLDHFKKGEKFNKLTECATYADYLVFAIILGIQFLKSDYCDLRKLAIEAFNTPCNGYSSAISGYRSLIQKYVCKEQRDEILRIFNNVFSSVSSEEKYWYFELNF